MDIHQSNGHGTDIHQSNGHVTETILDFKVVDSTSL
jgi:hypothetical protein